MKWTPYTKKGNPVKMTVLSVLLALFLPFITIAGDIPNPDGIEFDLTRVIATENTVAIGMTIRAQGVRAKINTATVCIYPETLGSDEVDARICWNWPTDGLILDPGETHYFWAQTQWSGFPDEFNPMANFVIGWETADVSLSAPVKPPTMTRSERKR